MRRPRSVDPVRGHSRKRPLSRRINIPLFIPHEGCPNRCVFCDQRAITGKRDGTRRDIVPEIEQALSTVRPEDTAEIAFFGGSFTGIDRDEMVRLLSDAYRYVKDRRVESIRLSTRPDYIDDEILSILSHYGVRHIELGIQSTDDAVLRASGRGHTAEQTRTACERIVSSGFVLGGQMMLGLPCSTRESEQKTARDIVSFGAREARIYPTVVFRNTPLCAMTEAGEYCPLTLDEAVERAADCCDIFQKAGVTLLRVGLSASDSLADPTSAPYGVTHSAFGELCAGALYRRVLIDRLSRKPIPTEPFVLRIDCPRGDVSKVCGHGGCNKKELFAYFSSRGAPLKRIVFSQIDAAPYEIRLSYLSADVPATAKKTKTPETPSTEAK